MDSQPSTSSQLFSPSPPKKRKQLDLGHLSLVEKQNILNMYKNIVLKDPDTKITTVVSEITNAVGVAKSTVYRVVKEYKDSGSIKSPKSLGGRPVMVSNLDEGVKTAVRQIIHSFFFKNELPTVDKILTQANNRPNIPNMSRSSLHKFMKKINFKYMKRNRKSILIERDDIILWRRKYLNSIKKYRSEGRPIYYLDETWVNEGHTKDKVWVDDNIKNRRQAFNEGLSTGLKSPSGIGQRLIILHVGSELGFVEGALLVFVGKKTADYHEEMNSKVFEEWFRKLLVKLPENAVIVMDNASYHSRKSEKIPTSSSKKKDMQEWIQSKNIEFDECMVRCELLQIIRLHRNQYDSYVTDTMASDDNKIVLRLPQYHCELNPIELIWAQIKNEVASKNKTFKMSEVQNLLSQAVNNVSSDIGKKCVEHVVKEETKMCQLDGIMDTLIEPLIISLGENSDSSLSESDDD